jgi:hypothetical protein
MTAPTLLHCDLCILAYQLYHQSVIWPLDPWYEVLARGMSDRRTLFMKRVHTFAGKLPSRSDRDLYGGPGVVGGIGSSNDALDPILTNYSQIRPHEAAFSGDGEVFIGIKAPSYLTQTIRRVSVCLHATPYKSTFPHGAVGVQEILDTGEGSDELIAFEGGTGSYNESEPAWSLMGYVLKRTRADHSWDCHIVFRGSRSGNAVRAATSGMNGPIHDPSGNADWVSDMGAKLRADPYIGGDVAAGFAGAVKRCMGTIQYALRTLHKRHGAPKSISIAGHSLGAALACLCLGATNEGSVAAELVKVLPEWDFRLAQGYFYALPPVGTESYCKQYTSGIGARTTAPYVAGDMVVECSLTVPKNERGTGGKWAARFSDAYSPFVLDRMPRPAGANDNENSHEIYLIRLALLKKLADAKEIVPSGERTVTPWATFTTFGGMLEGRAVSLGAGEPAAMLSRDNLRAVLSNYAFAKHFRAFLAMLKDVVADPKSYRGAHLDETYKLAGERVALALEMATKIDSDDPEVVADTAATQVAAMIGFEPKSELTRKGWRVLKKAMLEKDGAAVLAADELLGLDFNVRIGLGIALATFEEKTSTKFGDLLAMPELAMCFEVELPDVSEWQKLAARRAAVSK